MDNEIVYFSLRSHLVTENGAVPIETPILLQTGTAPAKNGDGKRLEEIVVVLPDERKKLEAIREFHSLFEN